jgi:hypothetical protein
MMFGEDETGIGSGGGEYAADAKYEVRSNTFMTSAKGKIKINVR